MTAIILLLIQTFLGSLVPSGGWSLAYAQSVPDDFDLAILKSVVSETADSVVYRLDITEVNGLWVTQVTVEDLYNTGLTYSWVVSSSDMFWDSDTMFMNNVMSGSLARSDMNIPAWAAEYIELEFMREPGVDLENSAQATACNNAQCEGEYIEVDAQAQFKIQDEVYEPPLDYDLQLLKEVWCGAMPNPPSDCTTDITWYDVWDAVYFTLEYSNTWPIAVDNIVISDYYDWRLEYSEVVYSTDPTKVPITDPIKQEHRIDNDTAEYYSNLSFSNGFSLNPGDIWTVTIKYVIDNAIGKGPLENIAGIWIVTNWSDLWKLYTYQGSTSAWFDDVWYSDESDQTNNIPVAAVEMVEFDLGITKDLIETWSGDIADETIDPDRWKTLTYRITITNDGPARDDIAVIDYLDHRTDSAGSPYFMWYSTGGDIINVWFGPGDRWHEFNAISYTGTNLENKFEIYCDRYSYDFCAHDLRRWNISMPADSTGTIEVVMQLPEEPNVCDAFMRWKNLAWISLTNNHFSRIRYIGIENDGDDYWNIYTTMQGHSDETDISNNTTSYTSNDYRLTSSGPGHCVWWVDTRWTPYDLTIQKDILVPTTCADGSDCTDDSECTADGSQCMARVCPQEEIQYELTMYNTWSWNKYVTIEDRHDVGMQFLWIDPAQYDNNPRYECRYDTDAFARQHNEIINIWPLTTLTSQTDYVVRANSQRVAADYIATVPWCANMYDITSASYTHYATNAETISQAMTNEYRTLYNANIAAGIATGTAIRTAYSDAVTRTQDNVATLIPSYDPSVFDDDLRECLYEQYYDYAFYDNASTSGSGSISDVYAQNLVDQHVTACTDLGNVGSRYFTPCMRLMGHGNSFVHYFVNSLTDYGDICPLVDKAADHRAMQVVSPGRRIRDDILINEFNYSQRQNVIGESYADVFFIGHNVDPFGSSVGYTDFLNSRLFDNPVALDVQGYLDYIADPTTVCTIVDSASNIKQILCEDLNGNLTINLSSFYRPTLHPDQWNIYISRGSGSRRSYQNTLLEAGEEYSFVYDMKVGNYITDTVIENEAEIGMCISAAGNKYDVYGYYDGIWAEILECDRQDFADTRREQEDMVWWEDDNIDTAEFIVKEAPACSISSSIDYNYRQSSAELGTQITVPVEYCNDVNATTSTDIYLAINYPSNLSFVSLWGTVPTGTQNIDTANSMISRDGMTLAIGTCETVDIIFDVIELGFTTFTSEMWFNPTGSCGKRLCDINSRRILSVLPPEPPIQNTKKVDWSTPGPYAPWDTITFELSFENTYDWWEYLEFFDYYDPTKLIFSGATVTPTSIDAASGVVYWDRGNMDMNDVSTVLVSFEIATEVRSGEIITNRSKHTLNTSWDTCECGLDTDPSNNTDIHQLSSEDVMHDLALIKTLAVDTSSYMSGDSVTFDITIENQGDIASSWLVITDYIPAWLTLDDPDWILNNGVAEYDYGTNNGLLPVWWSDTIPITFMVDGTVTGSIINRAEISQDIPVDADGNPLSIVDTDSTPDALIGDLNGTPWETPWDDAYSGDDNLEGTGNDDEDDHDGAEIIVEEVAWPEPEVELVNIYGTIYFDDEDDDDYTGDIPIAGQAVTLYDDMWNIVATTTTDTDGNYAFEDLVAGTYSVGYTNSSVYTPDSNVPGSIDTSTGSWPNSQADGIMTITQIQLDPGEDSIDNDFWLIEILEELVDIYGTIYFDDENDDNYTGDAPVVGQEVKLLDQAGNIIITTTTDANGDYAFEDLPAGDYQVMYTNSSSYTPDSNIPGLWGSALSIMMIDIVSLSPGEKSIDNDFGLIQEEVKEVEPTITRTKNGWGRSAPVPIIEPIIEPNQQLEPEIKDQEEILVSIPAPLIEIEEIKKVIIEKKSAPKFILSSAPIDLPLILPKTGAEGVLK